MSARLRLGSRLYVRYSGHPVWHERYVLEAVGSEGCRYVILTPDQDIYTEDFSNENQDIDDVRLVGVGGGIPVGIDIADTYRFRALPSSAELPALIAEGRIEAESERFREGGLGAEEGIWLSMEAIGDIKRGDIVPLSHQATIVNDRAIDTVMVKGEEKHFCCRLAGREELDVIKKAIGSDETQDARVLPIAMRGGIRQRDLKEAVSLMVVSEFSDWKCPGPRTGQWCLDFLSRKGGGVSHHEWWRNMAGLGLEDTGVAEHECCMKVIDCAATYDQVDIVNICAFEHVFRKAQLWEFYHKERVRKEMLSSREKLKGAVDIEEQMIFLGSHASEGALMIAPTLLDWVSKELERLSQIDKQARKAREERALRKG